MTPIPDEPHIAMALRTGYPDPPEFVRMCPACDEEMTEYAYTIDGVEVCEECFKSFVAQYTPQELADVLDVSYRKLNI